MTEKEKAIEDETIELPTGPAEKKKPHRGRIVVITVAALALLAAGGLRGRERTSPRRDDRVQRAIERQGRQHGEDRREKREGREDP